MLLLLYYSPTPENANESVRFIINEVPFGWLVRSIHNWSSHLMVATVFIHFFSTYFMKAYRKPREIMWVSGVLLLFIVLGFGFTGYLLPWDTTAYFATQIGTEVPKTVPVLGELIVNVLRGGEFVAENSLKRLFALHVTVLPMISLVVIFFHLLLNQLHGTSIPIGTVLEKKSIPFYPNYLFRDLIAWLTGILMLVSLAIVFPVQLGMKADPLASAPLGIRPEWYFLTLYQTLRMVPSTLFGLNGEMVVNMMVGLVGILLLLLPFLDRRAKAEIESPVFKFIGFVGLGYMLVTITLAYLT